MTTLDQYTLGETRLTDEGDNETIRERRSDPALILSLCAALAAIAVAAILVIDRDPPTAPERPRPPVPACAEMGTCVYDHEQRVYVSTGRTYEEPRPR